MCALLSGCLQDLSVDAAGEGGWACTQTHTCTCEKPQRQADPSRSPSPRARLPPLFRIHAAALHGESLTPAFPVHLLVALPHNRRLVGKYWVCTFLGGALRLQRLHVKHPSIGFQAQDLNSRPLPWVRESACSRRHAHGRHSLQGASTLLSPGPLLSGLSFLSAKMSRCTRPSFPSSVRSCTFSLLRDITPSTQRLPGTT